MSDTMPFFPDGATKPIFGIRFDSVSLEALAETIGDGPVPGQKTRSIVTANVDHIVLLRENAALREAYRNSWRRTIDGTPVWLYARLRQERVPDRVTGADLFPQVLSRLAPSRHRLFFVVATNEIAQRMQAWLQNAGFAAGQVGFDVPPFGFEKDVGYGKDLSARIRANGTTHLFFGVGCPRSEIWIDHHRDALGDVYALAVGAAIGFFAGTQRRAPKLFRRCGMEWSWRLFTEPRRLGPRYIVRSWAFLGAIRSDMNSAKVES